MVKLISKSFFMCLLAFQAWLTAGMSPLFAAQQSDNFTRLYSALLADYWRPAITIHGIETTAFDYRQMAADAEQPDSRVNRILDTLRRVDPEAVQSGEFAKAFWINVYNFAAMHLVLQYYPVDSIRSLKISLIKYPWSKKVIDVGGRRYTLGEIEKQVLLKRFGDPRIVFAVSCAAVSCPDQGREAFSAPKLEAQLDELVRRFLHNPGKGLRLDRQSGVLTLTMILKKEAQLFSDGYGGVTGFILPYLDTDTAQWLRSNPVRIEYFSHDWTLNDIRLADGNKRTETEDWFKTFPSLRVLHHRLRRSTSTSYASHPPRYAVANPGRTARSNLFDQPCCFGRMNSALQVSEIEFIKSAARQSL